MFRFQTRRWKIYQVLLFIAVWIGWYRTGGRVDPRENGGLFAVSIVVGVIVWWLLARHTRSTLVIVGGTAGFLGSGAALLGAWWFITNKYVPGYGLMLAFPLFVLWLLLLRLVWRIVKDQSPYEWR